RGVWWWWRRRLVLHAAHPQGMEIPTQVARDPRRHLEVGAAVLAVEPYGRQLGDRQAATACLGDHLDPHLEPCVRLDSRGPQKIARVRLERIGRVVRADAREQ